MSRRNSKPQCLMPNCKGKDEPTCRGLCDRCYQASARRVRLEETTWEELVEAGYALPANQGRPGGPASKAIQELNASK